MLCSSSPEQYEIYQRIYSVIHHIPYIFLLSLV